MKTIKQMEASLDDNKPNPNYDADDSNVKVTYPLMRCLQGLKDKYNAVSKLHRERFEQVRSEYMPSMRIKTTLTACRTRRGPRIIRLPSRNLLRPGQAASHGPECHHLPLLRHLPILRRVPRQ